jgi:hypothetical protein
MLEIAIWKQKQQLSQLPNPQHSAMVASGESSSESARGVAVPPGRPASQVGIRFSRVRNESINCSPYEQAILEA